MPKMPNYIYSSPAVQPFSGGFDDQQPQQQHRPRIPIGRQPAMSPAGPGMAQPYGDAFDGYNGQPRMSSPGFQSGPTAPQFQQPQQQPQAMPFEQQMRMRNAGQLPRGPSLGSTLGRTRELANDPITGAIAARLPGNEKFADVLGAGMAPQLQSNQMGAIGVQNAQAMQPFYPQMAQQQVRGATIQNDSAQSVQPFLPQQAQADVGKTNAEAGAITASAGSTPAMMNEWQQQAKFHQQRADRLQAQLDKLTGQGQVIEKADARNNTQQRVADQGRMASGAKVIMDAAAKNTNPAATQPSYKDAMEQSIDANGLRGSPTTMPLKSDGDKEEPKPKASPATQPVGQIQPDGSGVLNGDRYIQDPATGNWHKVKQPTTAPTTQPTR